MCWLFLLLSLVCLLYFKKRNLQLYIFCLKSAFGYDFPQYCVSELSTVEGIEFIWHCQEIFGVWTRSAMEKITK
jgi:hypothetical protein